MQGFRLRAVLGLATALVAAPVFATDVGVSVSVGQPGFYGRIDIGNYPQPALIYPQPIVVQPAPVAVARPPLYLHVPPGHAKKWSKHCHRYNACGQPVYFVREEWYQNVYVPQYARSHGGGDHDHDHGHGHGRGHGHGKGKHRD
ncbi:MAG TPA: hypothetical protein VFS42_12110 [Burkholderiaceae bacterium]|nr:hypothetical protein [Burkholderiaceae bacterium]